jgi:hypothetical protein
LPDVGRVIWVLEEGEVFTALRCLAQLLARSEVRGLHRILKKQCTLDKGWYNQIILAVGEDNIW